MGMVNSETPADIFCNQFFTIFFVIYCAARNSLTCVPDAFTLKSQLSLYPVFHHKTINFSLGAKGIFFAVFCIQKALGILFLKTHLLAQRFTFFAKNDLAVFCISFTSRRNCFQELNGFVIVFQVLPQSRNKEKKNAFN